MPKLTTVGLDVPADFPAAPYESCHARIQQRHGAHSVLPEFAGAWNAVAYRFQAMVDAGADFAKSIGAHGSHPPPKERYEQESLLSSFYGSGFATFESAFYALHALGAMTPGSPLSLVTAKDKQSVSPPRVQTAFAKAFAGDPCNDSINAVINDTDFKSFRETRNILTHRTAPGRTMFVGIGSADELPTEWKLNNMPLDETIATSGRAAVARLLTTLVGVCDDFSRRNL